MMDTDSLLILAYVVAGLIFAAGVASGALLMWVL